MRKLTPDENKAMVQGWNRQEARRSIKTVTYKGWIIHTTPDSVTATKDGEELTIRKFDIVERGLELMRNAIDRREESETKQSAGH
jgi:hypothetical protein